MDNEQPKKSQKLFNRSEKYRDLAAKRTERGQHGKALKNIVKQNTALSQAIASKVRGEETEVEGNMSEDNTSKSFSSFVAEAKKRGRPRKLKAGEQADTEHLQDQLAKLTHPHHVEVHFKDNTKHDIPRGHANKALQHLAGLKPSERAAHVDFMHGSHDSFYKILSGHKPSAKKTGITLAGKYQKEEVELLDEAAIMKYFHGEWGDHGGQANKAQWDHEKITDHLAKTVGTKHPVYKEVSRHLKAAQKAHQAAEDHYDDEDGRDADYRDEAHDHERAAKQAYANHLKSSKKKVTTEEAEQIDELSFGKMAGYTAKSAGSAIKAGAKMAGKAVLAAAALRAGGNMQQQTNPDEPEQGSADKDKETLRKRTSGLKMIGKKMITPKTQTEEVEQIDEWGKSKAIKGPHASTSHTPGINPGKVKYAGKGKKAKAQNLDVREDSLSFRSLVNKLMEKAAYAEDYAPPPEGKSKNHPDEVRSPEKGTKRKQGGDKPEQLADPMKGKYTQKEVK